MRRVVGSGPIVVVDDDPSTVQVMAALLKSSGYCALTIPLGNSASISRHLLDLNPALVFLDLTLGHADGREVARRIREAGGTSYLVACSGWGGAEEVRDALAAGFDEHWLKPMEWAHMRSWLDAHVPVR